MNNFDKQFNIVMEDIHVSTSLNILTEDKNIESLQKLLDKAQEEESDSIFFKNRGSKQEYIKMLKTKISNLKG
tara:strand:- start:665 stop:883 length:219 start_codon:yes stop_codon:yes gene_type:complete